jgi:rod shape-determining protein MreC
MQQLLYFLKRFRYFLLFLLLEIVALILTVNQHSYHQSKVVNSANQITGGLFNKVNTINEFFLLKDENQTLADENIRLKNQLEQIKQFQNLPSDSVTNIASQAVAYFGAKIINNNFSKRNNVLTINAGSNNGIEQDMGVINSKGIIGVTQRTSGNFSTVLSILNSNSKINVRLKKSDTQGTLTWNGLDYNICQIEDIPRQALLEVGDTIITGGKSAIFPEGIPVGVVKDFQFEHNIYKEINITLFNDMSAIGHVQVIKNFRKKEQELLEQQANN